MINKGGVKNGFSKKSSISLKLRKLLISLLILIVVSLSLTMVSAYTGKWTKNLPMLRGGVDLYGAKTKLSSYQYESRLDRIDGWTNSMWFIIRKQDNNGNWIQVCGDDNVAEVGKSVTISMYPSVKKGDYIMLVGGNNRNLSLPTYAEGRVIVP